MQMVDATSSSFWEMVVESSMTSIDTVYLQFFKGFARDYRRTVCHKLIYVNCRVHVTDTSKVAK